MLYVGGEQISHSYYQLASWSFPTFCITPHSLQPRKIWEIFSVFQIIARDQCLPVYPPSQLELGTRKESVK